MVRGGGQVEEEVEEKVEEGWGRSGGGGRRRRRRTRRRWAGRLRRPPGRGLESCARPGCQTCHQKTKPSPSWVSIGRLR
eukprot:1940184-Pyramimonas_sp.AAC.1